MFLSMSLVFLLGAGRQALACSSCGSGGADPVVLNPYENHKLYLGLSQQAGFRDIDKNGEHRRGYGPERKQTLDLAWAERLSSQAFVSAVATFGRNVRGSDSEMQNGDLALNARWNLMQANIAEPWIPQVQLLVSHRFAVGRSMYDQKRDYALDVFGAGYDETYVGADLWYGMNTLMFGGSVIFGLPQAVDTEAGRIQPGAMQRWIGTVGGLVREDVKLIGGVIHEQRGGFEYKGEKQPDSDRLSHDAFLTFETLFIEGSNYRLTLNRRGVLGRNRNAVHAHGFTLAWMRAL
ncbi:hypothetical protein [Oligoflexus tunisiensis]|uniref:hypothetical protein n=1 Tax=Oligoflexus tunisiensis TaxID=708132 RepID=UPI001C405AC4|nr:hypothetical protein [Oligoflexus tunisiensis]